MRHCAQYVLAPVSHFFHAARCAVFGSKLPRRRQSPLLGKGFFSSSCERKNFKSFPNNRINSSRREFHLGGRSGLGASESEVRSGNEVAPWDPWVSRRMRTQKKDFRDIASSAISGKASRCPLAGSSPKLSLAQGDPVNVLLLLHQLLTCTEAENVDRAA